jgi:hypothetical protein
VNDDEPGAAREDGSMRVLAWPWQLAEDGAGRGLVVDWRHARPGESKLTDQMIHQGLDRAAERMVAAVYLAGRLVAAQAAGYAVTDALLVDHADEVDETVARHARALEPAGRPVPSGWRVLVLLAGQVAATMWLEAAGSLTAPRYVLTWMLARADHDALLELDAGGPVAFLYGADAQVPDSFTGEVVRVEEHLVRVRAVLAARWHRVTALADELVHSGWCRGEQLAAILAAPAPACGGFDTRAAEQGALVAGYPQAGIDAVVEEWTRTVDWEIQKQNAEDVAILAAHPERAQTPGWDGLLAFTAEQQNRFRSSLRTRLIALIGGRVQAGGGGLVHGAYGERRVLELSTAPAVHPALISALETVGAGRYPFMLPHSATTVIAPDAAWQRDESGRETLLWYLGERIPACTAWIERAGAATGRCTRQLLHAGPCAAGADAAGHDAGSQHAASDG